MPGPELSQPLTPDATALGYPGKIWTEAEIRAMLPATAHLFIPPQARVLYRDTPTHFLFEAYPLERDPGINVNHEMAKELLTSAIYTALQHKYLLFASLAGPMAGGKSTVVYDMISQIKSQEGFPLVPNWSYALFKQKEQIKFDGAQIITHGERTVSVVIPYDNIFDILGLIDDQNPPEVIFAEEVQFAFAKDKEERSEASIRREIGGFLKEAEAMGIKAIIFTSLDFDFRGEPWPHMRPMLRLTNQHYVLGARCVNCNGIAYLTQKYIYDKDSGIWRPARRDEPRVVAGNVGEDKVQRKVKYQPECRSCHQESSSAAS